MACKDFSQIRSSVVVGSRLRLIPFSRDYLFTYFKWLQSTEIQQMTETEPMSFVDCEEMFSDYCKSESRVVFLIQLVGSGIVIGDVNLSLGGVPCLPELSVMIGERKFRRNGYAREAILLLMNFYGSQTREVSFCAKIQAGNTSSISLFTSIGFVKSSEQAEFGEIVLSCHSIPAVSFTTACAQLDNPVDQPTDGCLIGVCNPLLDISAAVDEGVLRHFNLQPNGAIFAEEEQDEIVTWLRLNLPSSLRYSAGGAGQNSIRAAQWALQKGSTCYFGCIGKDENGDIISKCTRSEGILAHYQATSSHPTGTCVCLINGKNRSLVARLGAANCISIEHFQSDRSLKILERGKIFYLSGFLLAVSLSCALYVAEFASSRGRLVVLNLSASYVCESYLDRVLRFLPFVGLCFGNESELDSFVVSSNRSDLLQDIEKKILFLATLDGHRTVVITRGSDSTVLFDGRGFFYFQTDPVPSHLIIDTNGAGDVFVGGFLASLIMNRSNEEAVAVGHAMAASVIQRSGISFQ